MTFAELRDFIKSYYMTWATKRALNELIDLVEAGGGGGGAVDSVNGQTGVVVLDKDDIGLTNVDNTTDLNKPISTATQAALDLKADINSPTFTGTVSGITKSMVGLSNVDNTTDLNKPISTATQTALNLKADQTSLSTLISNLYEKPFFLFSPAGQTVVVTSLGGQLTVTGTATAASLATTNVHTKSVRIEAAVTTAATTAVAGYRQGSNVYLMYDNVNPETGWEMVAHFGPSRGLAANATKRLYIGMTTSANAAPTDVPINTPSGHTADGIGFGYDDTESNMYLKVISNSVLTSNISLGASFTKAVADNTDWFKVKFTNTVLNEIYCEITNLTTLATYSTTVTTGLPRSTARFGFKAWASVGGTNSVIGLSFGKVYVKGGI